MDAQFCQATPEPWLLLVLHKTKFGTYAERRTFISAQFTPLLDFLEFGESVQPSTQRAHKPEVQPSFQQPTSGIDSSYNQAEIFDQFPKVTRNKRKVFIVHGRDNEAKQEVARFISDLGLEPIVLHEQASQGRTIIEKIERYTNDADFALVLYTACDHGRGASDTKVRLVIAHGKMLYSNMAILWQNLAGKTFVLWWKETLKHQMILVA